MFTVFNVKKYDKIKFMLEDNFYCSFCKKKASEVKKLIAKNQDNIFICDECVKLSSEILKNDKENLFDNSSVLNLTPKTIKQSLDEYIIGQEKAKKKISVSINNHINRIIYEKSDLKDNKSNVLMIGPTGTGKTLMIKVLQKILSEYNIPIAFADATTLTESGYAGDDVDSVLIKLLQAANYNINSTQKGIVFIDEIDKIAKNTSNTARDVSGESVQQSLLNMLQGAVITVNLNNKKQTSNENITIDTKKILFICAGAFSGLQEIIKEDRIKKVIGFNLNKNESKDLKFDVESKDLIKFGLTPEFVGRLNSTIILNSLSENEFYDILINPSNSLIKYYEDLFNTRGGKLTFEDNAIKKIANIAYENKLSARGLKKILDDLFEDVLFDLEDLIPCEVIVDHDSIMNKKFKIINKKQEQEAEVVIK